MKACKVGLLLVLSLAFGGAAFADQAGVLSPDTPSQIGTVEAVCTGIGLDARQNPLWQTYPLKIEVAGRGGQYLGDVHVTLSRDNQPIASLICSGPWILFKTTPGRYRVEAWLDGRTASSSAFVPNSGQGRIILRFPDLGGAVPPPTPPANQPARAEP